MSEDESAVAQLREVGEAPRFMDVTSVGSNGKEQIYTADGEPVIRLNLGAGKFPLDGFRPIDRKLGSEVYPLPDEIADESVEEIRASHVLEHFSYTEVGNVMGHWASKLRPGGCIKVAVPDFLKISEGYRKGEPIDVQGYVMGGHLDANDRHGSIFDAETLTELMVSAGLERIGPWKSELDDCAALPISLNLMGFKPTAPLDGKFSGSIAAILSAPRFGPVRHFAVAAIAFGKLHIPYFVVQGAFWHQVLCEEMEKRVAGGSEFILTCDFDTLFTMEDVLELYRLMRAVPQADAIMATQMKRGTPFPLFSMKNADGKNRTEATAATFNCNMTRVATGHFGLTIFRSSSLASLPRPWMMPIPSKDGRWGDGKIDADIDFWQKWEKAGKTLHLANKVVVGHIEENAVWPGRDMKPVYQNVGEWMAKGIPAEVKR